MTDQTLEQKKATNGVDTQALVEVIDAFQTDPGLGTSKFRISNRWIDGDTNVSTVEKFYVAGKEHSHCQTFTLESGEPPVLLGKDQAVNPVEYVLHALAGCITTSTVVHAAARGIKIQSIETAIEGELNLNGFLQTEKDVRPGYEKIRIHMKVVSDATGEKLEELKRLHTFSPVFDTIKNPVNFDVVIEA